MTFRRALAVLLVAVPAAGALAPFASIAPIPARALFASSAAAAEEAPADPLPSDDRFFTLILGDADLAAYDALPLQEKAEWRRRYWASVDPTPTTDENQREMEHQRRVLDALRLFRDKNGRFVFDDRVRASIRFGKPDRREKLEGEVVIHNGLVAPREFWLYPDMILWFEDRRLDGTYEEGLTTTKSGIGSTDQYLREDTGWQVDEELEFEESFDQFLQVRDIEVDPTLAKRYTDEGQHRFREVREINDYEREGKKDLRFIFDVSYLAGPEGRSDVLVGFLVPIAEEAFAAEGGVETARIQKQAALFDPEYDLIDRRVENMVHTRPPGTTGPNWVVTSDSFAVDPGSYVLALRFVDERSKDEGSLKAPLEVPSFRSDSIRISDIVFANEITTDARGGGAFARGGYRIVPRPIRVFAPEEKVRVYYEIYNIASGPDGRGRTEVRYTLFGTKAGRSTSFFGGSQEGKLELGIAEPFQIQDAGPTASRYISFDVSTLPDDRYTLTIDVTDLVNKTTDRATAQFVLKR